MTKKKARSILVTAFRALSEADRVRLLWHVQKGTPICCGNEAGFYVDGAGGG